jgi:prepilin-type N-terminal cleavage/methylation domain-containing protein
MFTRRHRRRGFSMLEMLMVIAIMGILSTVSVSYLLAAQPHARLEQAELELTARLNSARHLAVSEECRTRLRFDTAVTPPEYWVQRMDNATGTWTNAALPLYALPAGVTLSGNTFAGSQVNFNTRGGLVSGGTLTLTSETGETSVMTGNLASGRFQFGTGNTR